MILGGQVQGVASGAGGLIDRGLAGMFRMWDRLAAGDAMTWVAFVAVSLFATVIVGFLTGAIRIGRK